MNRSPNGVPLWQQCADLAANGLGPKEIAHVLGKSAKTIEGHLATAKKKLGIKGWGQGPFIIAAVDKRHLGVIDNRLKAIDNNLKLALDILLEMSGH